ncbi:MAG: DUF4139 domain-containing protein [Bacteroidetes bacterium]|nr:DUF4139 domain-containing protein [Bacteroidota bacterium]
MNRIVVQDLAYEIGQESISLTFPPEVNLMNVLFQKNFLSGEKNTAAVKLLQDSVKQLQEQLELVQLEQNMNDEELNVLVANRKIGGESGVEADQLDNVMDVYTERFRLARKKSFDYSKQVDKLNQKIMKLNMQISELGQGNKKPEGNIVITLESKAKVNGQFELSYIASGVSWYPVYDIKTQSDKEQLSLKFKAIINQYTGENWSNVKLTLASGSPFTSGEVPVLSKWILNQANWNYRSRLAGRKDGDYKSNEAAGYYAPQTTYDGNAQGNQILYKDKEDEKSKQRQLFTNADATYTWTTVSSLAASDYVIATPVTIANESAEFMLDVETFTLDTKFEYRCVPKLDNNIFLVANILNFESLDLLPGKANVYLNNSFLSTTYVNPKTQEDTLVIGLGIDKRFVVKRTKLKEFSSKKFLNKNIERETSIEISVKSMVNTPVTVTIYDQYPISSTSDIVVNLIKSDAVVNPENNELKWVLKINPNETIKKDFTYMVKYPKGMTISCE